MLGAAEGGTLKDMNLISALILFLISTAAARLVYWMLLHSYTPARGISVQAMLRAGSVLGLGVWCGHLLMLRRQEIPLHPLTAGMTVAAMIFISVAYVMTQVRFPNVRPLWRSLTLVLVMGLMLAVGIFNAGHLTYPPARPASS